MSDNQSQKRIGIKLVGEDVAPGRVASREVARVIMSIEEAIAAIVVNENPTLKKESIILGLTAINEGSLELTFDPNLQPLTIPAMNTLAKSINTNNFDNIPPASRESLKHIIKFTKKHANSEAQFFVENGSRDYIATVDASTVIVESLIDIETVVYGTVMRVGGVEPKVMLNLLEGYNIFCSIKKGLAQEVSNRLYKTIGFSGRAKIDPSSLEIRDFTVISLVDYEPIDIVEAFKGLAEVAQPSYSKIDDVDKYVNQLRGED